MLRASGLVGIDITALERAVRAGLVSISGERVLFRHPLVRSSVYGAADPDERRTVHRILAGALPDHDLERRAWHLAEAAVGPDEAAAELLEQVGHRAATRTADAVASTAYERAARLSSSERGRYRPAGRGR